MSSPPISSPNGKGYRGPGPQLHAAEQDVAVSLPVPATASTTTVGSQSPPADGKGGPQGKLGKYDGYLGPSSYYGGGYAAQDGYSSKGYMSSPDTGRDGYSMKGCRSSMDKGYSKGGQDGCASKGSLRTGSPSSMYGQESDLWRQLRTEQAAKRACEDGVPSDDAFGTKGYSPAAGKGTWSSLGARSDAPRGSLDKGGAEEAGAGAGLRPRKVPDYDVVVEVSPRMQPSFRRGPENTFVFELGLLKVLVSAFCKHGQPQDREVGDPDISSENEIVLNMPEVQQVVFDPANEQPPEGTASGSVTTRGTILQLPQAHSLAAKIKLRSLSGSLVLEDQRVSNTGQRQKVGENTLHYKLQVDGHLPISKEGADEGMHCLGVSLQLGFTCIFEVGSSGFPAQPHALRRPVASSRPVVDAGTGGGGGGRSAATRPEHHNDQADASDQTTAGAQRAGAERVE